MRNAKQIQRILRAHLIRQYKSRPHLFGPLHPSRKHRIMLVLISDLHYNKPGWLGMGTSYYKEWLRLYLEQAKEYRRTLPTA